MLIFLKKIIMIRMGFDFDKVTRIANRNGLSIKVVMQ